MTFFTPGKTIKFLAGDVPVAHELLSFPATPTIGTRAVRIWCESNDVLYIGIGPKNSVATKGTSSPEGAIVTGMPVTTWDGSARTPQIFGVPDDDGVWLVTSVGSGVPTLVYATTGVVI